jgi:transposase
MKYRRRIYYSAAQRAEIWDRWQRGESMNSIGRVFDRQSSSVFSVISPTGGIRPPDRLQSGKTGGAPRRIGRTKGGLNSKLHALCDGIGRPLVLCLSEGQLSDHIGVKLIYPAMSNAKVLIGHKGYDSDELRDALNARKIKACIPPRSNRTAPRSYSKSLYKQRHKVENMFAKLKDWRRIATRHDRCAHTFMSAICIAATVIFWINQ